MGGCTPAGAQLQAHGNARMVVATDPPTQCSLQAQGLGSEREVPRSEAESQVAMLANEKRVWALANMPIPELLWKYFTPAFIGVIVMSLYNIVDRIFIGQGVGPLAIAGLSVIFPIMLVQIAFGLLLGIGGAVRVSIALGEGNRTRAENILGHAFLLMLIVGLCISGLGYLFKEPLLNMFGATAQTVEYARRYFNVILLSSPFSIIGYGINHFIRAEGNARIAMLSMLIGAVINTALDALFIMGLGWGVEGAAYATLIALIVVTAWVVIHFCSRRATLRLRRASIRFDAVLTWSIVTAGFSTFFMQLANSIVQATFNRQLIAYGSDHALSVMGIVNSVAQLLVMSIIALNQAAQPIYGYNLGARQFHRLRHCLNVCLGASIVLGLVGSTVVQLFPAGIVHLFDSTDERLVAIGRHGLRIFFAAFPVVAIQVVASGYFQSVGKAGVSAFVALLRQLIILVPLVLLLPNVWGLTGVWMAAPLADSLSAIVCIGFLVREYTYLNRQIAAASPAA